MRDILLAAILTAAVAFDLRQFRVPNALVVVGLVAGIGTGNLQAGLPGALGCLAGAATGLIVLLPFWMLRWMGAGDVKLLAVAGSFAGFPSVLWVALYTIAVGGLLGLLSVSIAQRTMPDASRIVALAWHAACSARQGRGRLASPDLRAAGSSPDSATTTSLLPSMPGSSASRPEVARIPYALAIAAGTLIWRLGHA